MVGRTKRPSPDQSAAVLQHTSNAVNACGLNRFVEGHRRQYRGNALGHHGLAGTRRPDEQNVVSPGAGDFQSALGGLLAAHIAQIHTVLGGFAQEQPRVNVHRLKRFRRIYQIDGLRQGLQGEDVYAFHNRGLASVGFRDGNGFDTELPGGQCSRQGAAHRTDAAIQRQLAQEHAFVQGFAEEMPHAPDQAEGHG